MALSAFISTILFAFALLSTSIAETVTLKHLGKDNAKLLANRPKSLFDYRFSPPLGASSVSDGTDDLELLDVVLLASVDGKLHALNRTSGRLLWSMSSGSSSTIPRTLAPLVRTSHVDSDPDLTDDDQELYIIEPQSGDIYVLSSPLSPLKRLSLSMPQLVDLSPFTFSSDDDRRIFEGKKETSLLLIDLETGRVKNSECPWDPFEDLHESTNDRESDDSDGQSEDASAAQPREPLEIYIGRTDYHVSIFTQQSSSSSFRAPVQKLSFSTYGPNNQDSHLQSTYHRTPDDTYIQPLPNGNVIPLKARVSGSSQSDTHPTWARMFKSPIVAVFDVLRSPGRRQPFALLQPCPRVQDVLPGRIDHLPNLDAAFVGLVEESGSLYTMTPDHFPLVIFGDTPSDREGARLIEGPSGTEPADVDNYSPESHTDPQTKTPSAPVTCHNGSPDRQCLTGVRRLGEDSRSRISRLLDGAPSVGLPPDQNLNDFPFIKNDSTRGHRSWGNSSIFRPWLPGYNGSSVLGRNLPLRLESPDSFFSTGPVTVLSLFAGIIWLVSKIKSRNTQHTRTKHDATNNAPLLLPAKESPSILQSGGTPVTPLSASVAPPSSTPPLREDGELAIPSPTSNNHADTFEDVNDGEESEKDGDAATTPGKRKNRRGKRGRKRKTTALPEGADDENENEKGVGDNSGHDDKGVVPPEPDTPPSVDSLVPITPPAAQSLIVSDTVLGFGSHGTVVFKGSLQGRSVAVKRLLQDFVTLAAREISVLQESDDHPNVIRYYYQESHANFLYIALELCPASLADVIENPDQFREISITFNPKRAVRQITSGIRHLHGLKIIHRDIKPQNILISSAKQGVSGPNAGHRMLISDFGLCKKLDVDQTSFLPTAHGALAAGTVGWRAPEILRGEVKLDESLVDEQSQSSRGSVGLPTGSANTGSPTRLTKSVDIFALGCLLYYTLTNGDHPFGDRFEREVNILKNTKNLDGLRRFGEEGSEATDLIEAMLSPNAHERPDATTCLLHPYFWDPARRLAFLQDASDRFEIMCREPRDSNLVALETNAASIVGNDWHARLDKVLIENLGKFRKYDGKSVQDLLRALRNKKHHYQDLPDNVKRHLGPMPEGFLSYFTRRYPRLFLHVHSVIASNSLHQESMFKSYFDLSDP